MSAAAFVSECKLCASRRIHPRYKLHRLGLTVFECEDCSLGFIGDALTTDWIDELYGREGLADYFLSIGARHERKFAPRIAELPSVGIAADARVLDVGCGSGEFAAMAATAGYDVVAIDVSEPSIRAARELHPGVDFRVTDARAVADAEPASFDLVTLWDVIEHVLDPHAVIADCADALREGGLLAIGTPNGDSLYDSIIDLVYKAKLPIADRMVEVRYSEYHLQIWTVSTLAKLVGAHGLEVVSARRHRELTGTASLYVALAGHPRWGAAVRPFDPVFELLWPIRNKLTLYARKRSASP